MAEATHVAATVANSSNGGPDGRVAEQHSASGRGALADHHDRGGDRRLQDREPAEHRGLGEQVGVVDNPTACSRWKMGRSPTRSRIVRAVPMNAAAGISRLSICADSSGVPACGAGDMKSVVAGHRQGQRAQDERQQRQEDEIGAVGDHQADLPAGDRRDLAPHAGVNRFAEAARLVGLVRQIPLGPLFGLVLVQEAAVGFVGVGAHLGEDLGPVGGAHRPTDLVGRAAVGRLAAGSHQQHLVADVQVGQQCVTTITTRPASANWRSIVMTWLIQRRIQTRGRLVEDQQRRPGQQLERHRGAFALSAGQLVDAGIGVLGQVEFFEHLGYDLGAVGFAGVRRQPQLRGVAQRLVDRQLAMHHVVLRDHADPAAQRCVLGVNVVALEGH